MWWWQWPGQNSLCFPQVYRIEVTVVLSQRRSKKLSGPLLLDNAWQLLKNMQTQNQLANKRGATKIPEFHTHRPITTRTSEYLPLKKSGYYFPTTRCHDQSGVSKHEWGEKAFCSRRWGLPALFCLPLRFKGTQLHYIIIGRTELWQTHSLSVSLGGDTFYWNFNHEPQICKWVT